MRAKNLMISLLIIPFLYSCNTLKRTSKTTSGNGLSYETAIVVNSISEEYVWVKKNHPGGVFKMQALSHHDGKPYDVLTFNYNGAKKKFYFDISKFFGKGF